MEVVRRAGRPHGPGHRPRARRARGTGRARQHAGRVPVRQRRLRRGARWSSSAVRAARTSRTRRATASRCTSATSPAIVPGTRRRTRATGVPWANLSNTPFRYYKHWVHEGGIATPFIVHWPAGRLRDRARCCTSPFQLADVVADRARRGRGGPASRDGRPRRAPAEGRQHAARWPGAAGRDDAAEPGNLYWEHRGNAAVRRAAGSSSGIRPAAGSSTTSSATAPS